MKDNMKHAITVKECSQVVENAHLNNNGRWLPCFRGALNHDYYSIYQLCWTVMNDFYYPTPQGASYWNAFRRREPYYV